MGTPGSIEQSGIPNLIASLHLKINTNRATQIDYFRCSRILVKSDENNIGNLYVGMLGVNASTGFKLLPGQGIDVHIRDSSKVWIASDTDGLLAYVLIEVFGAD